jgi:small subunit ribosomal protein S11
MPEKKKARAKKKERRIVPEGKVFIQSSFNNTIITITDAKGNVIAWGSPGNAGFKGSRKGTPYAAQLAGQAAANKAKDAGVRQVEVYVRGPGSGREAAIRAIQASGIMVTLIKDMTPIPHNGCRPRKRRRV